MRYLFILGLILMFPTVVAADILPLNPDYVKWREVQNSTEDSSSFSLSDFLAPLRSSQPDSDHPPLTRTPSPVNREFLRDRSIVPVTGTADYEVMDDFWLGGMQPSEPRYDLRDYGYTSPIKNQNPYGSCWSFAALTSLESSARRQGLNATKYYSEKHLAYYAYENVNGTYVSFDIDNPNSSIYDLGGDDDMAISILSRWTGAVSEQEVPYADMGPCEGNPFLPEGTVPPAYANNSVVVDAVRHAPAGDQVVNNIKYLLKNYGAVSTGIKYEDEYYNSQSFAFYNPDSSSTNHAVTIVGWDDMYSRSNFNTEPYSDGAWIVANSWGDNWGDQGYFYVSYEDLGIINDGGYAYEAALIDPDGFLYLHDYLGQTGTFSRDLNTLYAANVFTAVKDHAITRIGVKVPEMENSYVFSIYTDLNGSGPTSGTLAYQSNATTFSAPGFHYVNLPRGVNLKTGTVFSIVVKIGSDTGMIYAAIETPISDESSKAKAVSGEGFYSIDGVNWSDVTETKANTSLCLRAFATKSVNGALVPVTTFLLGI